MQSIPTRLYILGVTASLVGLFGFAAMPWFLALIITIVGLGVCGIAFMLASPNRRGMAAPGASASPSPTHGLPAYCLHCGGSILDSDLFCEHCGEYQSTAPDVPTPAHLLPGYTAEQKVKKWARKPLVIVGSVILMIIALGLFGAGLDEPENGSVDSVPSSSAPSPTSVAALALKDPDPQAPVRIASEGRCSPYDANDYPYPQSVETEIVAAMNGHIFEPYTGRTFSSTDETDIEHIVARSEAHDSGLCAASPETRKQFSSDLLNLTLASPDLNRQQKGAKDAAEWLPARNQCWFAGRVIQVKQKYSLTIDYREAETLESILSKCDSFEMNVGPAQ